ncbi:MAG: pirin family protein [Candidatus Promineifilaceae bacterium]
MESQPRSVVRVIHPQMVIEGAGVRLQRSFGPSRANPLDPFLLFDHFAFNDPIEGPIAGFPTHPHRGIETVTYMLEGNVRHRDSLGNMGIIGPGDVQWMTSGRGILHEEMPRRGPNGRVNGFQLWVNLPAAEKMGQPRYQEVKEGGIPTVQQNGTAVRVVAGEYQGVQGPVGEIAARPLYMDIRLEPGTTFTQAVPRGHTAVAYVFEGAGTFGPDEDNPDGAERTVQADAMIIFGEGDRIRVQVGEDSPVRFMFMAGGPFGEPIVPYGPFVMNTPQEIQQALDDLRNGTFVS